MDTWPPLNMPSLFPPQGLCIYYSHGLKLFPRPPLCWLLLVIQQLASMFLLQWATADHPWSPFTTRLLLTEDPCSLAPYLFPSDHLPQVTIIYLVYLPICLQSCFSYCGMEFHEDRDPIFLGHGRTPSFWKNICHWSGYEFMKGWTYTWVELIGILYLFWEWISGLEKVSEHSFKRKRYRSLDKQGECEHLITFRRKNHYMVCYSLPRGQDPVTISLSAHLIAKFICGLHAHQKGKAHASGVQWLKPPKGNQS